MGLDTVEIVLRTEEVFGISLRDEECGQIITIGDLYRAILATVPWTAPEVWLTPKTIITDQLQIELDEVREQMAFLKDFGCD